MIKMCIIEPKNECTNCGECDKCDLDSTKICNNCGKCLNLDDSQTRSIFVDEIIDDPDEGRRVEKELEENFLEEENITINSDNSDTLLDDYNDDYVKSEDEPELHIELIDDIDGLQEVLDDENNNLLQESFPGFYVIKNKNV